MGTTAWGDSLPDRDFARLRDANVRLFRMDLVWRRVEPREPGADGMHHYNWDYYDGEFRRAARRGVRILPLVHGSPRWVSRRARWQPTTEVHKAAFDAFATAAARRYGPNGSLWTREPWSRAAPAPTAVRPYYWQVWNEPNTRNNWYPGARPTEYAAMLKRVSRALKRDSPSLRVMAAGLFWPADGMDPEPFLRRMLQVSGVLSSVDAFAIHPYARIVVTVMGRVRSARRTLNTHGASTKPIHITEIGWASGPRDSPIVPQPTRLIVPESKQASNLDSLYRELLSRRRRLKLLGAVWFSYRDRPPRPDPTYAQFWGDNTGLLRSDSSAKPAWRVFKRRARYGY